MVVNFNFRIPTGTDWFIYKFEAKALYDDINQNFKYIYINIYVYKLLYQEHK